MEITWQKTTFGELKEGDVFCGGILPDGRSGYDVIFMKNTGPLLEGTFTNNETVYRLVSPERDALEKIVAEPMNRTFDNAEDGRYAFPDYAERIRAIAKAALEGK